MTTGKRRSSRRLTASHQRSWLWGRHAVLETLRAGRWPIDELLVDEELPPDNIVEIGQLAEPLSVFPQLVTLERLTQLCQTDEHQGFLARMGEFPYEDLNALGNAARSTLLPVSSGETPQNPANASPLFLICDSIQDAHNFGAILRCCDAVRADGVIIGERSQALVTPHVARASSGAANHQHIFRVPELTAAVQILKDAQFQIVAATEKSDAILWTADLSGPTAFIVGSEAFGIATELLEICDSRVSIPMLGQVDSLNAAVAAGIVLYECRRQQMRACPHKQFKSPRE
ncbi:MAG TPA: 23S rRNA (guanosine(2251)-2'-O)-methyltransferase RlmB [Planctomycetaceae bacterium]|nr:23S rRNA (guanosine(2251)-2'-O)-methyltransferase RlmB [Planctomycetaceae bacterium]